MRKPELSTTEFAPQPVQAFRGVAIFADYDGEAPDTEDLILCASVEVADEVCAILNKNPRYWNNLAFVDGSEWCKSFKTRFVTRETVSAFYKSAAEVFEKDDLLNDVDWDDPDLHGKTPGTDDDNDD